MILRPYYPVSGLFRLQRESDGLQIDFMAHIDGVNSYEGVRGRANLYEVGGYKLLVASPDDIAIKKQTPKGRASREKSAALKAESDRALIETDPLPAVVAARKAPQLPAPQDWVRRYLPLNRSYSSFNNRLAHPNDAAVAACPFSARNG